MLADECLVLQVEAAEAARRLAGRPGRMSRVEGLAAGERAAELERIGRDVSRVAGAARARAGMRVRRLGAGELEALLGDPRPLVAAGTEARR
jgi:hypothetical protein